MQQDAFKPQGKQLGVIDVGNPLMNQGAPRRQVTIPQAPSMGRMPQVQQQQQAPLPMDPAVRGAAISSERTVPRGAQEVRMAGPASPPLAQTNFDRAGASFQPSAPAAVLPTQDQVAPAPAPVMGQAPRPFLQRPQFQQRGSTIFRVTMRGIGPDGAEYASVYDAEFPAGTQPADLDFAQLS